MAFSPALPALAGPLACVHPLDPEFLDAGVADLAASMLQPMDGDPLSNHWRYHLAHAEALPLSPTARAALLVATDRLSALLTAEAALQHAGEVLVRELEAMPLVEGKGRAPVR